MVTISKNRSAPVFSYLAGDIAITPGQPGAPYVIATPIGKAIKEILRNFDRIEPNIKIMQYSLMPDHVHILLFVTNPTQEVLGRIIARFKVAVNKAAGMNGVFDNGFNDQILKTTRSLNCLFRYIRENPYRLAVRRSRPDFFRRVSRLDIGGVSYQAYGNLHLLANPFKEAVVVHRRDTPQERERCCQLWLYTAVGGGVLVSPFISPAEKAIRAEADALGGRTILITDHPFPDRFKPAARDFALCCAGRLLIISDPPATPSQTLSRSHCLHMNALAQILADMKMDLV